MAGDGGKGKGKGGSVGSRSQAKAAANIAAAVVPSCAAVQTGQSVPPPPAAPADLDTGTVQTSITLASRSMPALAAGVVGAAQVPQVAGCTGTSEAIAAGAESTAGVEKELERKRVQTDKKRKQREQVRAGAQVSSPTTASIPLQGISPTSASVLEPAPGGSPRSSPRKSQIRQAVAATGNWSAFCDVRMVLVAISSAMEPLLTRLGHAADRQELQGSTSDNKCDPTHAFFAQLAESFNNEAFLPLVPAGWDKYDHMPKQKVYTLRHARDAIFLQGKWNACRARVEIATRRYSSVSGTDGFSCFCGCGALGFFSTSGYQSVHANKLSRDDNTDGNGSKLCVAPPAHLGVYMWYLAMQNNDLMNQKGSVAIPAAARHQGLVGTAGSYAKHHKTIASHRSADPQNVDNISDSDSDRTLKKKQKKGRSKPQDHTRATFMDDGQPCKLTKANREGAFIAALDKMAPERQTRLESLRKREADLFLQQQSLLVSLTLAHNLKKMADASDEEEMSIAKKQIVTLNESMRQTEKNQQMNQADILKAEEEHSSLERSRSCKQDLLAALEHNTGKGKPQDLETTSEHSGDYFST
jgi:hypothetical protein